MTGSFTYQLKWSNVHAPSPLLRPRSISTRSNIRFKRPKRSHRSLSCKLCIARYLLICISFCVVL